MISRTIFVLFVFCLSSQADALIGWGKNENRMAFFDPKMIWDSVPFFQVHKKELEETLSKFQKKYATIEGALREEGQALQKEKLLLEDDSPKESKDVCLPQKEERLKKFEARWNAFNEKVGRIQKTVESKKRCIGEAYEKANEVLQKTLQDEIELIAKKKGIFMIVTKDSVAYAVPELNLTFDLIDALKMKPNPASLTFDHCERMGDE